MASLHSSPHPTLRQEAFIGAREMLRNVGDVLPQSTTLYIATDETGWSLLVCDSSSLLHRFNPPVSVPAQIGCYACASVPAQVALLLFV